ncbi:MAG TPA: zf-TFIIB domain-containing protein [Planctomycetota bacterium]|nr:zf-TFIIB domain-containing protein [Planctomycetota bacterium]
MRPPRRCPACGGALAKVHGAPGARCAACGALVLRARELPPKSREKIRSLRATRRRALPCADCGGAMRTLRDDEVEIARCESCGSVLLDPGAALPGATDFARERALFALSLPERSVRALLGTAGATARELTHVLVPPALRQTRFWSAAIERSLKLLAEGVGRVPGKKADAPVDVARMAVGSVVDTAALVFLQFSPLWLLAVVHDVAKGSRAYLDEVVGELKQKGLLAHDEQVEGVDHLLGVLERTSGRLQADVDLPPLSLPDLRASVEGIREAVKTRGAAEIEKEAKAVAVELERTSKAEGRSVLEVSNAVALSLADHARRAGRTARIGVDVAARLFVERGWKPYLEQLDEVRRIGFARYLADAVGPIGEGIARSFDPSSGTVTEGLVSGKLWRQAVEILRKRKPKETKGKAT